jgi:hypothetical protein
MAGFGRLSKPGRCLKITTWCVVWRNWRGAGKVERLFSRTDTVSSRRFRQGTWRLLWRWLGLQFLFSSACRRTDWRSCIDGKRIEYYFDEQFLLARRTAPLISLLCRCSPRS